MGISNPLITEALRLAWRATASRPWNGAHERARLLQHTVVLPWLAKRLRDCSGISSLELQVRNSAARAGRGFNVFKSDLDLAAVLPSDASKRSITAVWIEHARIRRVLPFVGELEVYTREEWEARLIAWERSRPALELLGGVRKIRWQEAALRKARSRYHREKALASIQATLDALVTGERALARPQGNLVLLATAVSRAVSATAANFHGIPAGIRGRSGYLDCWLADRPTDAPDELVLAPAAIAALLAWIPDGETAVPSLAEAILSSRSNPRIANDYSAIVACELSTSRSVSRNPETSDPMLGNWIMKLEREAERFPLAANSKE